MRILFLFLGFLFWGQSALAGIPPAETDRLERIKATAPEVATLFRTHATDNHMPGFAWGVIAGGRLLYSGATGHSELTNSTPVDARTLFRIASMSKSFTALAILQLRDAGKLALDTPVSDYLPETAGLELPTADSPRLTLRHLLTHAGGLPEDNPWGDRQLDETDAAFAAMIDRGFPFSTAPGVAYEYSNVGFTLLGRVVQAVSGQPFAEYMREHVFRPLGMARTTYEFGTADPERLALGYGWRDGAWFQEPHLPHGAFGAMGGLISSIEEFASYAALHLSAWPPRDEPDRGILARASLREMHRAWNFAGLLADYGDDDERPCPTARAYGYGLRWRSDCQGRRFVGHSGGLPGFGSNWMMLPDYDLAVVSFDNLTYGSTTDVNLKALDLIVVRAGLAPRPVPVTAVLAARREALVEVLRDFDRAESSGLFAENFFLDTPLTVRRREVTAAMSQIGEFVESAPLRAMNRLRGTFRIRGSEGELEVFFSLSPESPPLIQALRITPLTR